MTKPTTYPSKVYEITITPKPTFSPATDLSGYKISWLIVRDLEKLSLHSNLADPKYSTELIDENKCRYIINGGFFNEEGKHIGLFISNGEIISSPVENRLFNAYFSLSESLMPTISRDVPNGPKLAVQSGPLILANNKPVNLSNVSEDPARRIIVATNDKNEVIFIIFYNS